MKKKKIKAIARAAQAAAAKSGKPAQPGKPVQSGKPARAGKSKEERRMQKIEQRRREKAKITPSQWAAPAPSHLVGKREVPKVKSKYQSYFEFAENTEKKKKLEFKVTNDINPPPGFAFVPIGDPEMTNMCKDLSRTRDAMIFIVSTSREGNSKVSEHMYRTGYHFREAIVDDARAIVGETVVSPIVPGQVEPIPETQEEINKQADAAIRDLFPRIPNTDRTMIIEHAFKKGALFHGEPTVGLQDNIPLSRRVQLAVLAHIRHTHTRYDELLRETSWINARKVVEPVCLDILVKWRGDEETGRDQMDEILREVVIITDSEAEQEEDDDDDEDSSSEDGSEEEGEVTSESSPEVISLPNSRNQQHQPALPETHRPKGLIGQNPNGTRSGKENAIASRTRSQTDQKTKEPRPRGGFSRYEEVSRRWDEAQQRQRVPAPQNNPTFENPTSRRPQSTMVSPLGGLPQYSQPGLQHSYRNPDHSHSVPVRHENSAAQPAPYHSQRRPSPAMPMPRNEVIVTQRAEQHTYQRHSPHFSSNSHPIMEQRPPQVVRGSPQSHGLQDMLVPSIESPSSDPAIPQSSRLIERRDIQGRFDNPQDSYSRTAIDDRRVSPVRRQVVVIDDDSPPVKRRRMVREDDSGHFRPLPSRDYIVLASSPPFESHSIRPASVQPRDFPIRRPDVQSESSQGLLEGIRSANHTAERIPIYDAPAPGSLARPPEHFRRDDDTIHREELPRLVRVIGPPVPPGQSVGEPVYRRPVNVVERGRETQSMRMQEHDRGSRYVEPDRRVNVPQSSNLLLPQAVSRSYDIGPRPVVTEQALSHEFSQSRLEGPPSHTRGGFDFSERPRQSLDGNLSRHHGDHSDRSFSIIPPARARSPIRYVERPTQHEEIRRPIFYGQNVPVYEERYDSPSQRPILVPVPQHQHAPYGRVPPPRREIIALD